MKVVRKRAKEKGETGKKEINSDTSITTVELTSLSAKEVGRVVCFVPPPANVWRWISEDSRAFEHIFGRAESAQFNEHSE